MEFKEIVNKARKVQKMYAELERVKHRQEWGGQQLMLGFMGDVGDLAKLVTAKEGLREIEDVDNKLEHELVNCLWAVLVLADKYNIDLEKSFLKTMEGLEERIKL